MNPYTSQDFWGFFVTLFLRVCGRLPCEEIPSDELQIAILAAIGIGASLLGTLLTLRRMTMIANSLSHTILLGIVLAFICTTSFSPSLSLNLPTLLLAALLTGLLTTTLTEALTRVTRLQEDASIGLVFTTLFALGVVIVTIYTRSSHIGTEAIMGNVDVLHPEDLKIAGAVLLLNLAAVILLFKEFKVTSFDPPFSGTLGIPVKLLSYLLMVLTAATAIAAFRAVGVILVLAFITAPACTARQWTCRLHTLMIGACLTAVFCSVIGVALSRHFLSVYHLPLSTGSLVVTLMGAVYALSALLTFRGRDCLILGTKEHP